LLSETPQLNQYALLFEDELFEDEHISQCVSYTSKAQLLWSLKVC